MLSIGRRLRGPGPAVVAIFLIAALIAACGSAAAPRLGVAPGASAASAARGLGESAAGPERLASGGEGKPDAFAPGQQGLLIIKQGEMSLQVKGLDAAVNAATEKITSLGGYASGSDRSGDDEFATASITFRIPAARWDEALAALRGLATKVLSERSSTEDVTTQVVDLGARIKNLQATEQALQAIMARATAIKDVLAVQSELTTVRGEIEQMTAEKSHLEQQAAMSTLTVTFALKPNPILTSTTQFDPGSEAERASASLVNVLQGVATAGIWFAIVWLPILLFVGVIGGVVFLATRRFRRAGPGAPSGDAPVEPAAEGGA